MMRAESDIESDEFKEPLISHEDHPLIGASAVDYNVIQKDIGDLGRYQLFLVFIAYLVAIPGGLNMVSSVFLEAAPEHWCALPPLDDSPEQYPNLTIKELKNYTIPFDSSSNIYNQCFRYNYSLISCHPGMLDCIYPYPPKPPLVVAIPCDNGYRYNNDTYKSTVVSEWNLVCSRSVLSSVSVSVFFLGILVGSVIGGHLADRYGRIPVLIISQMGIAVFGIASSFSPTLSGYIVLRFFMAIFVQCGYLVCFVYVMEITGDRWRTLVGINVQTMYTVGELILSLCAFKWRDWRKLQLYISMIPIAICVIVCFLPESPRWLFSNGKYTKGKYISEKLAKRNGRPLSRDTWQRAHEAAQITPATNQHFSLFDLFKRPKMRIVTTIIILEWFVASLVFYGLALNIGKLSGNVYLNNVLNALVEPVCYVIIVLTMDRIGRKPLLFTLYFVGGAACLTATFVNSFARRSQAIEDLVMAIILIGKMAVAGAFSAVTNYTAELYPTVVRSTGVGVGSMGARIAGAITPFALFLQNDISWLTGAIFGIFSMLAATSILFLPETLNKPMLATLDEAEEFYKQKEKVTKVVNPHDEVSS